MSDPTQGRGQAVHPATEASVLRYCHDPGGIPRRLRELDQEWTVERALAVEAAVVTLAGVALAARSDRRWLALPAAAAAFLLQHGVSGRCLPAAVLRRMGVRSDIEVDEERYALKALRGDFGTPRPNARVTPDAQARETLRAIRR